MPTNSVETLARPVTVDGLVESLKRAWRQGTPPDVAGAMREYPELLRHRSLAVDLAYEEYCLLEEAGCPPEPDQFCQRLPAFASQIREVIRGHRVFADHPELFANAEGDWPRPGDSFEGLALERELGRGGFARVYLARDPATGNRPIALKLSPNSSGEARTLGPITHPHIVAVHWAKQVRKWHTICMPFVGATTLADVIDAAFRREGAGASRSARTILDEIGPAIDPAARESAVLTGRESYPDAAAAVAVRLADALAYLHRSGVSHGDLKPSNVILGSGGHPYLIDFNLATGLNDSLLRCGGTVPYMAPERLRLLTGEREGSAGPAAPTDVYSLGAVLFEMLTGHLPFKPGAFFDPKGVVRDLLRRQSGAVPDATAHDSRVPRSLARLLAHCLSVDPQKRPSAQSLTQHLRHYLGRRARRGRVLLRPGALLGGAVLAWQVAVGAVPADPTTPVPAGVPAPNTPPEPPAVHRRPSTPDDFFRRGVESLRGNDTAAAMKDFDAARRAKPDGRSTAFLAYCHARSGNHKAAATLYQEAIRDHGYAEAWAHCNRAYSLIRGGSPDQLRQAINEATTALEREPKLRAARLNRAYARFLLDLDPKTQSLRNPGDCLADLEAILTEGPYSADLYYKAALVLAAASAGREEHSARAVNCLQEAVRRGRDPRLLAQEPVFRTHLTSRPDFAEVIKLPPAKAPTPGPNLHVVDPLAP
jgi:serine/threonine protein kinase